MVTSYILEGISVTPKLTLSTNLLALLSWLDVNLGPLLEGLSEHVPNQRFTGNLHGHHVASTFQNSLRGVKLTTKKFQL